MKADFYQGLIDTLRSVSEYDTGYAKLMYDAADAIEELASLVSPYCGTCRTCKLAHSVEVRGKKLLLCDFTERVVGRNDSCDYWEAD